MNNPVRNFRVATFNLLNYNAPPNACYEHDNIYSNDQWQKKEAWISRTLNEMKTDLIGFQEVFSPDDLQALTKAQGFTFFATADNPTRDQDHVLNKPVVALASKHPIVSCETIHLTKSAKQKSGVSHRFSFSRAPLKAEVVIKDFGQCLVYVVHLKSNRSSISPPNFDGDENWPRVAAETMLAMSQGNWKSLKQRGDEANFLYQDIVKEALKKDRPIILLGDLNTGINSETLQQITEAREIEKLKDTNRQYLPLEAQREIRRFGLHDAFDLQTEISAADRRATHYYANKGNVLDYILLSKDFDQTYDHSLASINSYNVFDRHLQNPEYEIDSQCSDHAPVMVEFEIRQ